MSTSIISLREALKSISRPLLKLFCLGLARVIKQDVNKVVFHSMPDTADNSWHLYRYMCSHVEGKHFVWFCNQPEAVREWINRANIASSNRVSVVKNHSLISLFHFVSAKYVFLSHGLPSVFPAVRRVILVNLWHGMPIKPIEFLNRPNETRFISYDYILSTSDCFAAIMSKAFRVSADCVIVTGLPRNDALLSVDEATKSSLQSTLEIDQNRRIVFWLPTFRKPYLPEMPPDASTNSFMDEWDGGFWERLSKVAVDSGCVVVIKLHPLDVLNQRSTEFPSDTGILFVTRDLWSRTGMDLYDALSVSSALVTDVSSVLIDYAVTGNPIAVTCGSLDQYSRGMINGTEPILDACRQIDGEDAFFDFIRYPYRDAERLRELSLYNEQAEHRVEACPRIMSSLGIH